MATWQYPTVEPGQEERVVRAARPLLLNRPSDAASTLFQSVGGQATRSRRPFLVSYGLEVVAIALLANVTVPAIQQLTPSKHYQTIELITDREQVKRARHELTIKLTQPRRHPADRIVEKLSPPKVELPRVTPPVLAKVQPPPIPAAPKPVAKFDSDPIPVARGNSLKPVETGVFSGSSAKPTLRARVSEVQTGGFGDPNGVPVGKQTSDSKFTIAKLGAFDLPSGPGEGNGSGGARGLRGTVASAGFGNGVAGPGTGDHGGAGRGSIHQAGFGDSDPVAHEVKHEALKAAEPALTPLEILEKPKPAYTAEARQLKLEGEVLLQVVFSASGQLQVVRVVHGLGHGLDEAAVAAAQRIRYKPALRQGSPVDFPATIHIVFQIA